MKKLIAVIFVTLLTTFAASAWAGINVLTPKKSQSARVHTVGLSTVSFSIALRDVTSQSGPDLPAGTDLTWADTNPNLTAWSMANRCVVLTSTINILTGGGVQIYTDNYNPPINSIYPKYVDTTPLISTDTNSNPGGLLLNPGSPYPSLVLGSTTTFSIPLAWSIKASSLPVTTTVTDSTNSIAAADPNGGLTGDVAGNKFQWLFVQDVHTPTILVSSTTAFSPGADYSRLIDLRGIHFGQLNADQTPAFGGGLGYHKSFVYFETNFQGAVPNYQYLTNLWFEAFTE